MTITSLVVAVAAILAIVGVVTYFMVRGFLNRLRWDAQFLMAGYRSLTSPVEFIWFYENNRFSDLWAIAKALDAAVDCVTYYGPWAIPQLKVGLSNLHLVVHDTSSWVDSFGRKVAGFAEYGTFNYAVVHVGSDFSALAHELVEAMLQKAPPDSLSVYGAVANGRVTAKEAVDLQIAEPRPDNWWTNTTWGSRILGEYEKRRLGR